MTKRVSGRYVMVEFKSEYDQWGGESKEIWRATDDELQLRMKWLDDVWFQFKTPLVPRDVREIVKLMAAKERVWSEILRREQIKKQHDVFQDGKAEVLNRIGTGENINVGQLIDQLQRCKRHARVRVAIRSKSGTEFELIELFGVIQSASDDDEVEIVADKSYGSELHIRTEWQVP